MTDSEHQDQPASRIGLGVIGEGPAEPDTATGLEASAEETPRRSLASNIAALATSQMITWALTLAWTLVVPRLLGPDAIGMLVIATSLASLVTVVLSFATRDFLVREMVSVPGRTRPLVSTALLTRAAAIPLGFLAAGVYGQLTGLDGQAMAVMYLTAAATGCAILTDVALAVFQARERMQLIAYLDVGVKSLNSLGGVVLAVGGLGVVALSSFGLLVGLLALAVALRWVHRMVGLGERPTPPVAVLRKAGPYWLVSVLFVAYVWADGLILGALVPTEVVGWYGAATRLFTTMGFVPMIIMTATLPRLIAAHADSPARMYEEARRPFEWVLLAGLPLGVGLACVADDLVPLLFGAEFEQSVIPLVVLALALPMTYVNTVAAQVFVAAGRPTMLAWLLTVASVVNIAVNLVLIPWTQEAGNGAIGAAMAMLVTEAVQLVLCLAVMGRALLARSTLRRTGAAVLAAAGMALVVLLADGVPLVIQVPLGMLAFGGLALLLRIPTPAEKALVAGIAQRIGTRLTGGAARS